MPAKGFKTRSLSQASAKLIPLKVPKVLLAGHVLLFLIGVYALYSSGLWDGYKLALLFF